MLNLEVYQSATIGAHSLVVMFTDRDEPKKMTVATYLITPSSALIDANKHNDAEALLHDTDTELVRGEDFTDFAKACVAYCKMLTEECANEIEAMTE